MKIGYLYLSIAILAEVIATSALKSSEGFTRPLPSLFVALGYGAAFYFLSLVLKTVPMGVAYAIWSGVGIVLIAGIGWLLMKQPLDAPALLGIGLIVAGVAVIQLFPNRRPISAKGPETPAVIGYAPYPSALILGRDV